MQSVEIKAKADFNMITTISTIAVKTVQRSLRLHGNYSSAIVATDYSSISAIVATQWRSLRSEYGDQCPAIVAITAIIAMVNIPECTSS